MQLGRGDISIVTNKKQTTDNLSNNERVFGSKITAIINSINALSTDKKIIIFGAWEKFLNTIAYALAQNNINYVAIKGNVNIRDKAIKEFQKNPAVRVILLSSEFGASGLNLTQATEVFITHPFLGEDGHQGEKQAISRAHRTGQTKEVNVSFFITDQTIESEIWEKNRKNNYSNTVQMKMLDEPNEMIKV
jgi:SNF2 family DNA or RNA helicase